MYLGIGRIICSSLDLSLVAQAVSYRRRSPCIVSCSFLNVNWYSQSNFYIANVYIEKFSKTETTKMQKQKTPKEKTYENKGRH